MFKSNFPNEYYLYNNPLGIHYNYPLSFIVNTFTKTNNKPYYIINYKKASQEVTLYLDILFGKAKKIRKDNNANYEKWIIIEFNTPLLANSYYHYDNFGYYNVRNGNLVIKSLGPQESK